MAIGGYSLVGVHEFFTVVASLVAEHGVSSAGSVVVVRGLSCSEACGIFPNQELNPCSLNWQVDS